MNDDLKVGDVCVVVLSDHPEFPVGTEVTILAIGTPPPNALYDYPCGWQACTCQISPTVWSQPKCLRKKQPPPPPREERGEWELCPWRPAEVKADA